LSKNQNLASPKTFDLLRLFDGYIIIYDVVFFPCGIYILS